MTTNETPLVERLRPHKERMAQLQRDFGDDDSLKIGAMSAEIDRLQTRVKVREDQTMEDYSLMLSWARELGAKDGDDMRDVITNGIAKLQCQLAEAQLNKVEQTRHCQALTDENIKLRQAVEEGKLAFALNRKQTNEADADAKRYRCLRDEGLPELCIVINGVPSYVRFKPEEVDELVDCFAVDEGEADES